MEFPKYSIVIPAYNESARIPATLKSVIACVRANAWDAEVIVVNDGSTDSTAQLVLEIAIEAPEVRLWKTPEIAARATACALAFCRRRRDRHVHRLRSFRAH